MILLDFDGVLINSRDEVVVTTYRYLSKSDATKIADLPPSYAKKMRRLRPFAGPASDLIPLSTWCYEDKEDEFSEELLTKLCDESPLPPKERAARFFATRSEFIKAHPQDWYDIHSIYEPFVSEVKKLAQQCVVLTNKNKAATMALLRHFEIGIPEERVFSGDNGVTKSENLLKIAEQFNQRSFIFFDDHAGVLVDLMDDLPEEIKVVPHLALWGFADPSHNDVAQERGYKMVNQEEAVAIIKSYLS